MKTLFTSKSINSTLILCFGYLAFLVGSSCVQEQLPDLYESCPPPRAANAIDLKVLYLPYINNTYSKSTDTVNSKDFQVVLELEPELLSENSTGSSQLGRAFALSCLPIYDFRNISNIAITLTESYGELQAGSDISYLFENFEGIRLSEIRDFKKFDRLIGLSYKGNISNNSQLKTRTFLFLKNGNQIVVNSSSPILKLN
ncbi:hypothetical protein [Algoriphagus algorifonticola]|uniref:hypothetical protein n=1 Tax=Algoriphagus algorifonticola TaxID=2593007 RepID=UPI00119E38ED|nr:hypothetical protein [Algoriphagus algorifonticola]